MTAMMGFVGTMRLTSRHIKSLAKAEPPPESIKKTMALVLSSFSACLKAAIMLSEPAKVSPTSGKGTALRRDLPVIMVPSKLMTATRPAFRLCLCFFRKRPASSRLRSFSWSISSSYLT